MQLRAEGVFFSYDGKKNILEDVNLVVNSGEVVGLLGPSGYGKSTLGKILAGYLRPQVGSGTMDGKNVLDIDGYHPVQLIHQHPEKAVNPKWKMRKIMTETRIPSRELIDALDPKSSWLDRYPNELSGGELQRFCVLRVLNEKTKFIIADEMTTMLDPVSQVQIWKVVLKVAKENNMGVLVISHDRELVRRVCDREVSL